jgi:pimeloyl-ACP methyl ester carboxylesterase
MASPAPGEARHFTASDGAVLHYSFTRAQGGGSADGSADGAGSAPPAAGSPQRLVVLVHGWSGSRRYFDSVIPALARRGCAVLAPDLRWHGDSAEGSPPGGTSHVARLGADLAELLAACAEAAAAPRVLLVGTSMGAAVIWCA